MTKVKTVIKKIRALGLSTFVRNPVLMDFKFLLLSPIELFCKLISSFGIKETTPERLSINKPEEILKLAVKRMLPRGPLAKKQMSKLKIYRGDKHPHEVQNPKEISLVQMNKKNLLRN